MSKIIYLLTYFCVSVVTVRLVCCWLWCRLELVDRAATDAMHSEMKHFILYNFWR